MGFFRLLSDLFYQCVEGDGSLLDLVLTGLSIVFSVVMIASSADSFRALRQLQQEGKSWTTIGVIRALEVANCLHFLVTPGYAPSNPTIPFFHPALIAIVAVGLSLHLAKRLSLRRSMEA